MRRKIDTRFAVRQVDPAVRSLPAYPVAPSVMEENSENTINRRFLVLRLLSVAFLVAAFSFVLIWVALLATVGQILWFVPGWR